jgi:ParB-like chromosome segregation protein Spo0J
MPNTQAVETNQEYRNIPIAMLVESPTNPRKRFDEKKLEELALGISRMAGLSW